MRLIRRDNDGNLHFEEFPDGRQPPYAILSHTWGEEEITYQDFQDDSYRQKRGFRTLDFCARRIGTDHLHYFWIDTCCIDNTNSTELNKSIVSMYRWYQEANKCYVFLDDVSDGKSQGKRQQKSSWESSFRDSRWFTRGWTLQELIAPRTVLFFSTEGTLLCDKMTEKQLIHEITKVHIDALRGISLCNFTIDERLAWADNRETTVAEDKAYCLQGLLEINMLPMYGEGENALSRLRKEIVQYHGMNSGQEAPASFDEEQRAIIESLQFDEIEDRLNTIRRHHKTTCQWILNSDAYRRWLNSAETQNHHGFLWIKGKPGSGKSTLAKFLFERSIKDFPDATVISFFFNARGTSLEKSTTGLYRSLLCQILGKLPPMLLNLEARMLKPGAQGWTRPKLQYLFERVIDNMPNKPLMIFVDALDECSAGGISDLVALFELLGDQALLAHKSFHVCFSSRHYPHIEIQHYAEVVLEDQDSHSADINDYIRSMLKLGNSGLARRLREKIIEKAAGVFLWVVLVAKMLLKEHGDGRVHQLEKRLNDLPSDLDTLFRDILLRNAEYMDELVLCLQWIFFAKVPLKPEEFYFAMLSGLDNNSTRPWNQEEITQLAIERFIISSSKGLAELTRAKKPKVQFIHESVRDFLMGDHGLESIGSFRERANQGLIHDRLKRICMGHTSCIADILRQELRMEIGPVLRRGESRESKVQKRGEREMSRSKLLSMYPFMAYATEHLLFHADSAQGAAVSQREFLKEFPDLGWITAHDLFESVAANHYGKFANQAYILAEYGCAHLLTASRPSIAFGKATLGRYGFAFCVAVIMKHKKGALALLGPSAISKANAIQWSDVEREVDELITEVDVRKTSSSLTRSTDPFLLVSLYGKASLVAFWLAQGFSAEKADIAGVGLVLAAMMGHTPVVEQLIAAGVDPDRTIETTQTFIRTIEFLDRRLHIALLCGGISNQPAPKTAYSIRLPDRSSYTALAVAAVNGRIDVMQILINAGAVVDRSNSLVDTIRSGQEAAVRLLIQAGHPIDAYRGIMNAAYSSRHKATMTYILGVLKNELDAGRLTASVIDLLPLAVQCEDEATVHRLLPMGSHVNWANPLNKYLLTSASKRGSENIMKLLIEAGAPLDDPSLILNHLDPPEGNPLSCASESGQIEAVRLLISSGAELGRASGRPSLTALARACAKGYEQIVGLLLAAGANPNSGVFYGCYCSDDIPSIPLVAACKSKNKAIVRVLLAAGARPEYKCPGCRLNAVDALAASQDQSPSFYTDELYGEIKELLLAAMSHRDTEAPPFHTSSP